MLIGKIFELWTVGESLRQFFWRVHRAGCQWLESEQATTAERVRDLFILEQIFMRLPANMVFWLRCSDKKTFEQLAEAADLYAAAQAARDAPMGPTAAAKDGRPRSHFGKEAIPASASGEEKLTCFYCHKLGHRRSNCPKLNNLKGEHIVHYVQRQDDSCQDESVLKVDQLTLGPGYQFTAWVNNHELLCQRDTGTDICIIRTDYVLPEQYLDKYVKTQSVHGTIQNNRLARVPIHSSIVNGYIEVATQDNCPAHFLLGNKYRKHVTPFNSPTLKDESLSDPVEFQVANGEQADSAA